MPDYNCEHCHDTGVDEDVIRIKVGDGCYSIFVGKVGIGVDRYTTFVKLNEFADAIRKAIAGKWEQTTEECSSCHGTGFVSIHENNINSPWRELWLQADKENITGDGWHSVPCPDCKEKQ